MEYTQSQTPSTKFQGFPPQADQEKNQMLKTET
jgi:hypothetical protein